MQTTTDLFAKPRCISMALALCSLAACVYPPSTIQPGSVPVEQLKKNDSRAFATAIIDEFDVDGDARISGDEFALATIQMFESADKNGDLKLDRQELGPRWNDTTERADTNHDGAVSLSEIMRDQDRQFHTYDRNGDEYLGLDELEAFAADRVTGGANRP